MGKKRKNPGKGSAFERDVCKALSIWWTGDNRRDDVFWRTSGSGGRARRRSKSDRTTFGQHGDIQAVDPIGQPLLDVVTIECKTGYPGQSISDGLDKSVSGLTDYEKFIHQAIEQSQNAGTKYWMLISRRIRKRTLVTIPLDLADKLGNRWQQECSPSMYMYEDSPISYMVTPFDVFLRVTSPRKFKDLS